MQRHGALVRSSTIALVVIAVLGCAPAAEAGAKKYVKNGNKYYFKLEYQAALGKYLEADTKMKPDDREYAIAMLNIASAYRKLGNLEKSIEYIDKASEKIWGPKSGWQSANLGFGTGVLTNESKQEWIGAEHERLFARFYAASAALELGNLDDAIIGFKLCEKVSENYPIVRYLHGVTAQLVPEERENARVHLVAVADLFEKIRKDSKGKMGINPYAALRLASIESTSGSREQADTYWKFAAELLEANPVLVAKEETLAKGTNVLVVLEKGWIPVNAKDRTRSFETTRVFVDGQPAGEAAFLDYAGQHDKIGSGDAVKQFAASYATEMGKSILKNVSASIIPGGGLVVGLFMGGKRDKSIATWDKISPTFYLYETRLAPGSHSMRVEIFDKKGKVGASAERSMTVPAEGLVTMSIPLCIKK